MKIWISRIVGLLVLLAGVGCLSGEADSDWKTAAVRGDWLAVRSAVGEDLSRQNALQSAGYGYAAVSAADFSAARKAFSRTSEVMAQDQNSALDQAAWLAQEDSGAWGGHLLHADVLARAGRYAEAEAAVTKAVGLAPSEPLLYLVRGLIRALAGHTEASKGDFARAIAVNPKLANAYLARGVLHVREGKPAEAQNDFEAALRLAPDFAVAANARGVALCQQGRYEDAIRAFVFALDLDPDYKSPARNLKAAKALAAPGRARVRIAVVAGRRAGGLGRRTIEVVIAEKDKLADDLAAGAALILAATGEKPAMTTEVDRLTEALQAGTGPILLGLAVPDGGVPDFPEWFNVATAVASASNVDVRLVTDGARAATVLGMTISKQTDNPRSPPVVLVSWEILAVEPPIAPELRNIAAVALALRAQGTEVRVYGSRDILPNWNILPPEQVAALPLILVPSAQFEIAPAGPADVFGLLVAQIAAGWAARPEQGPQGGINTCYFVAASGEVGVFLPDSRHPDFGWMKPTAPSGTGISVGVGRDGSNAQVIISGGQKDVLIRFDIDHSHGQKPHLNIQVGQQNIHTDKDGIEIKPGDRVVVAVGGGKVVININGEKLKEYEVPEADNENEVVIDRQPDGTTTVTQGGKPVGQVEKKPDGTTVIHVGDKVIEIPPPPEPQGGNNGKSPQEGNGPKDGQAKPSPEKGAQEQKKSTVLPSTILVGPGGVIILPGPADGPHEPPTPYIENVPPGWIIAPAPDGPMIIPHPSNHEHYPIPEPLPPYLTHQRSIGQSPPARGGVYTVDDTTLEVVSANQAGTGFLFGGSRPKEATAATALQCPFLIFPNEISKH